MSRSPVPRGSIVALIGPSGSGKSTLLRCLNRLNDLVPGCRVAGDVRYRGIDLYGRDVDPVAVRTRIGLVFQRPNPFPKSIFDNVAFGPRTPGFHGDIHDIVERALRRAALWQEVKDRLRESALALSGGQQQRLVIARALAIDPDILLMDEPASALDPISTSRIEDLMREITPEVTIVIVTHAASRTSPRSSPPSRTATAPLSSADLSSSGQPRRSSLIRRTSGRRPTSAAARAEPVAYRAGSDADPVEEMRGGAPPSTYHVPPRSLGACPR
jgi:ABC-type phosphate transport system ATPase subunit